MHSHVILFFACWSFLLGIAFGNLLELNSNGMIVDVSFYVCNLQMKMIFIEREGLKQWFANFFVPDIVTIVFGHDVLLPHHLGVPGAVSQLLLCNAIAVSPQNDCYQERKGIIMLGLGSVWSTYRIISLLIKYYLKLWWYFLSSLFGFSLFIQIQWENQIKISW